jgi:hypothetical protein
VRLRQLFIQSVAEETQLRNQISLTNNTRNLTACIVIAAAISLACAGTKRPWRDYSEKPFSSVEWLAGDKIERGRMAQNFASMRSSLGGMEPAAVTALLGPPDLKKTIEKHEVWFYRVDIGIVGALDLIPVSFDDKMHSKYGYAEGGTFSGMAKESDL